ncbi:MAG: hypothetical protein WCJ29_00445 [bacterium]
MRLSESEALFEKEKIPTEARELLLRGERVEREVASKYVALLEDTRRKIAELFSAHKRESGKLDEVVGGALTKDFVAWDNKAKVAARKAQRGLRGAFKGLATAAELVVALGGAGTFAEGCATVQTRVETKYEPQAKSVEKVPSAEEIRNETIARLNKDRVLESEIGEVSMNRLREFMIEFDQDILIRGIADYSKIDEQKLKESSIHEIRFLSDGLMKKIGEKIPDIGPGTQMVVENHVVYVRASGFLDSHGQVDTDRILGTLIHEECHIVANNKAEEIPGIASAKEVSPALTAGVPFMVYEGMTDLVAIRVSESMGLKVKDQAYAGGEFMAAYFIESLIGTDAVRELYFKGDKSLAVKQLGGENEFRDLFRENFDAASGIELNLPEGMGTLMNVLEFMRSRGIDPGETIKKAEKEGIREKIHLIDGGHGVVLTKDIAGIGLVTGGVIADSEAGMDFAPRLRFFATNILPADDDFYRRREAETISAIKQANDLGQKILAKTKYKDIESMSARDRFGLNRLVQMQMGFENKKVVGPFDVIVPCGEEIARLKKESSEARTPEEKLAVQVKLEGAIEAKLLKAQAEMHTAMKASGMAVDKY